MSMPNSSLSITAEISGSPKSHARSHLYPSPRRHVGSPSSQFRVSPCKSELNSLPRCEIERVARRSSMTRSDPQRITQGDYGRPWTWSNNRLCPNCTHLEHSQHALVSASCHGGIMPWLTEGGRRGGGALGERSTCRFASHRRGRRRIVVSKSYIVLALRSSPQGKCHAFRKPRRVLFSQHPTRPRVDASL
ncbi:hypothetical protein HBH89_216640 [Parastagonospora nodorum]|nr:hypothetical protein HBI10_192400 [Parastagonospora nodorum]KAH4215725.1 hypothetical protein HBI06_243780 [Parastagonospora nodorum]KAH4224529.1 hypothetical protein HBI05_236040 [Parastagonospora nodorum]KAH4405477.1 hypothetical protein HBH93_232340 [Parastagonospora nodorum]KAH4430301.1 hypothetical protein HBH91_237860 [Parastagonospora nodorum]